MKYLFCRLLAVVLFFICLTSIPAQNKVKVGWIANTSSGEKIVDLTETAERECSETLSEKIGESFVEIKFQPGNEKKAREILNLTKQIIGKTRVLLTPLPISGVRIYWLQLDDAPKNYKILVPKKDELFIFMKAYESDKEVELNCAENWFFCDEIYRALPHEFTHPALKEFVADARWFEEGVAEYVGFEVAKQIEPSVIMRAREIYVRSALFKPNIVNLLTNWEELTLSKVVSKKVSLNDIDFYSASQQLIREIIAESEKNGVRQPLKVLLENLQKMRREKNKPSGSIDIISLIKRELKVDITKLNESDQTLQQKLTDEAVLILLQSNKGNPNRQIKLYTITTLKNIETTILHADCLNFLLQIVFDNAEDRLIKKLSAEILVSRFNQTGFTDLIEKVCRGNSCGNKKKTFQIKNEIRKISEK